MLAAQEINACKYGYIYNVHSHEMRDRHLSTGSGAILFCVVD